MNARGLASLKSHRRGLRRRLARLSPRFVAEGIKLFFDMKLVASSPIFDRDWYLMQNPDVAAVGVDPLKHYLRHGGFEGRDPSPHFSSEWYLQVNPDVAKVGMNPLVHYLRWGAAAGRRPAPLLESERPSLPDQPKQVIDGRRMQALGLLNPLRPLSVGLGIVTYNNPLPELKRCLRSSLIALDRAGCEGATPIFLIDNGDPSSDEIRTHPRVRMLASEGNIGFGAGHNRLMSVAFAAGAHYYVAVNPDGMFEPEAIRAMLLMAEASEGKALIEALQFPEEHPKIYDPLTFDTPWASGVCLVLSRRMFEQLDGFDERFFMYCEDVDLSWRARARGFHVRICPRALFFHSAVDRVLAEQALIRYFVSGIQLARKWGSPQFESTILREAKSHQVHLPSIPEGPVFEGPLSFADFGHSFRFAPVRW